MLKISITITGKEEKSINRIFIEDLSIESSSAGIEVNFADNVLFENVTVNSDNISLNSSESHKNKK